MKKLIVGLLAAILMSAGLVAATSSAPASAVCGNPQYPACFETKTGLQVFAGDTRRQRVFVASVNARGTNANPVGTFVFRFKKAGQDPIFVERAVPEAGEVTLSRKFATGNWTARVRYDPRPNTIFQGSRSQTKTFKITAPRRR